MKTAFYSHTGQVSGAEIILLLLLKQLNRRQHEPVVICPAEGGLANRIKDLEIAHRRVRELEARFTWNPVSAIRYCRSLVATVLELRREVLDPDYVLVHANSIRAGLTVTLATLGTRIPVFWHLQDELKTHPFSTLVRLIALSSRRVRLIAASSATLESFRGHLLKVAGRKIPTRTIYNAIDLSKFYADEDKRVRTRKALGLSDDEFVFGIVGQITPRKGQLELVRSFADLARPGATLLIIGEPMFNADHKYLAEIREEIRKNGLAERVRMLGRRTDIPSLMRALDTLVVNSSSEAFVVVGIEAMASGTPVIATDVGGIREMIEDGKSGLIFQWGDRQRLLEAMKEVLSDDSIRDSFSKYGEQTARRRFSGETLVAEVENFFQTESGTSDEFVSAVSPEEVRSNV